MSCITQIFKGTRVREDGLVLDIGLSRPIPPTWGPLAPHAAPDARYFFPIGDNKILSHSSIHEIAQDSVTWSSFLSNPQLEESRSSTPTRVYILRKPPQWEAEPYGLRSWQLSDTQNPQKRAEVLEHNWSLIHSSLDTKLMRDEFNRLGGVTPENYKIVSEKITRQQAQKYGVELHIEELP